MRFGLYRGGPLALGLLAGLAAASVGLSLPATAASAAPVYTSPQTLSASGWNAYAPQVAIDGSDRATITWYRGNRIESVRLAPGGKPGALRTLSDGGQNVSGPAIAIDASDRATITWRQFADLASERRLRGDIQSVRLAANGTPRAVKTLSEVGEYISVSNPDIALDASGRATITWWWDLYGVGSSIQSIRLAANGTPAAVQTLSEAGQPQSTPQVAIDSLDRATIVWTSPGYPDGNLVQSVRLAADGTPGPVQTHSEAGRDGSEPQVAIDSLDRATIVWGDFDGYSNRIQSVRLAADGTPGPVQTHSEAGQIAFGPQIGIDGADRATIVWYGSVDNPDGSTDSRVQSVRLAADGTPGAVQTLSGAGEASLYPQIAIDSSDRATIVWPKLEKSDVFDGTIQSVRLAADGTPGAVQTLSKAGQPVDEYPQIAIDSSDRATIVWSRSDGTRYRIQSVTVDTQPKGFASAKGKQRQEGNKIVVKVKVKAGEDLDAKATGKVKVGKKSYKLKPQSKSVSSGNSKNLKLKPKKSKDAKKIAKALKKGKKAKAKLTVKLTDEAGNKKTKKLSVKLKR